MKKVLTLVSVLALLLVASISVQAQDEPAPLNEEPAEATEPGTDASPIKEEPLLERGRELLGEGYVDLTQTIDGFLAGKRLDREYNDLASLRYERHYPKLEHH